MRRTPHAGALGSRVTPTVINEFGIFHTTGNYTGSLLRAPDTEEPVPVSSSIQLT